MIRILIITANHQEMRLTFDKITKYLLNSLYGTDVSMMPLLQVKKSKAILTLAKKYAANFGYAGCLLNNNNTAIIDAPNLHIDIYPYSYVHCNPECIRGKQFDYCMLQSDAAERFKKELFSGMRMCITDFTDLMTIIRETIFYGKPKNEYFNPAKNFRQIIIKRLNSFGIVLENFWLDPFKNKSNCYTFIFKKGGYHILAGYEHRPEFDNRRLIEYIDEFIDSVINKFNTKFPPEVKPLTKLEEEHCINDIIATETASKIVKKSGMPDIKKVIFDGPATIVFWSDGTKTVSKAAKNDCIDVEKGLAMAISKKIIGNYSNFKKILRENGQEPENMAWRYQILPRFHGFHFTQRYYEIMKHLR